MLRRWYHGIREIRTSGPYVPAVSVSSPAATLYISGQGPVQENGTKFLGDIVTQTQITLANIRKICEVSGFRIDHILKVTIYLTDLNSLDAVNQVYVTFFPNSTERPARTVVGVQALPGGQAIEIDAIAVR